MNDDVMRFDTEVETYDDDDLFLPSEGRLVAGAVELDPAPEFEVGESVEDHTARALVLLYKDPLYEFLATYAGRRKKGVSDLFKGSPGKPRSLDFWSKLVETIMNTTLMGGELPRGDKRLPPKAVIDKYFADLAIRGLLDIALEKRVVSNLEEWARRRWDQIDEQVFSDAVEAVSRIRSFGTQKPLDANYYINHKDPEIRSQFALLAGHVGQRTDYFNPTRATFQANIDYIEKEIVRYADWLAYH